MRGELRQHWANLLTSGGHLVLIFVGFQIDTPAGWVAVLGAVSIISFFAWYGNTRRRRIIADTPTSTLASAAQGYVELIGGAKASPEAPLLSRLRQLPCVWFRYKIERRHDDKNWETVEQGESHDTILLDDGSGTCFVDPENAEIITSHNEVWHRDGYRYSESLLLPQDSLYVLGEFVTLGGASSMLDAKADVAALLAEWKRDQPELLRRFDLNGDGTIDMREWELARQAAKREVEKQHREIRLDNGVNVLRQPGDGRLFLLSNLSPEKLVAKYAFWAWLHLAVFFGAGVAAAAILA